MIHDVDRFIAGVLLVEHEAFNAHLRRLPNETGVVVIIVIVLAFLPIMRLVLDIPAVLVLDSRSSCMLLYKYAFK